MTDDTADQRIRERAYQIWQDEGQPEGRAHDHWAKAHAELADVRQETAKPAGKRAAGASSTKAKPGKKPAAKAAPASRKSAGSPRTKKSS
jgi:hypothetical protein